MVSVCSREYGPLRGPRRGSVKDEPPRRQEEEHRLGALGKQLDRQMLNGLVARVHAVLKHMPRAPLDEDAKTIRRPLDGLRGC